MRRFRNILRLTVKELRSLASDPVLIGLIIFAFSLGTYARTQLTYELHDSRIAVVDQDNTPLSRSVAAAFIKPYFRSPDLIVWSDIDRTLDHAKASFVLVIPPDFERDLKAGRRPELLLDIDATNVLQAFNGAGYIQNIISRELGEFTETRLDEKELPIQLNRRVRFNANLDTSWFQGVMDVVDDITMLSIVLVGAAVLREREHGTLEHLLVMPLSPFEIMTAKVWANSLVILVAAALDIRFIVHGLIGMPIAGSVPLFLFGAVVYLFSATSIGIYLSTLARSMPQFGLLIILVILPLLVLSGGMTPRESMPAAVIRIMSFAPTTYFVRLAQGVLYRGAGLEVIWQELAAMTALGAGFFLLALKRFRVSVAQTQL